MAEIRVRRQPTDTTDAVAVDNPFPVSIEEAAEDHIVDLEHNQVSVGTTATLIRQANARRYEILVSQITGTQIVYLGRNSSVSASNGQYLGALAGNSFTTRYKGEVWGIAATSAQTVSWAEEETD
mgnify:CR=1 FL=1